MTTKLAQEEYHYFKRTTSNILKRTFLLLIISAINFSIFAQTKIEINVPIKNSLTKREFDNSKYNPAFDLCSTDSISLTWSQGAQGAIAIMRRDIIPGKYLIKAYLNEFIDLEDGGKSLVPCDEYEAEWISCDLSDAKSGDIIKLPEVFLHRKAIELKEFTVTASRVMFYHKGDTLIYNADAFLLAEGSMLDALLEQLPGVSLGRNGEITVNGKHIDNLLLNGKDLFNGNNELMLENLYAYTVKDVAVYDKLGHMSELFDRDMNDKTHVMDVRLKREYMHGFIVNAEGGYGTKERYLGKLFGLWFSDNVSVSAYAGANNLSDESVPGKDDGAWSRDRMGAGVKKRQYGGLTYFAQGFASKWELKGNVDINNTNIDSKLLTSKQTYLNSDDVYGYKKSMSDEKNFSVATKHEGFVKIGKRVNINFTPSFNYNKNDSRFAYTDIEMNENLKTLSDSIVDAIYDDASKYRNAITNRSRNSSLSKGHSVSGSAYANSNIRLNKEGDPLGLSISGSANIFSKINDRFNRYDIKSGLDETPYFSTNRYFKNYPHKDQQYLGQLLLYRHVNINNLYYVLNTSYSFERKLENRTSQLYMLDKIDGYDGFGILPSISEYEPTLSPYDSYNYHLGQNKHKLEFSFSSTLKTEKFTLIFPFKISLDILDRTFTYQGRGIDTKIRRNDNLFSWSLTPLLIFKKSNSWYLNLDLISTPIAVQMLNLVNVKDNTDPLNIYEGNSDLRNARRNRAGISINKEYNYRKQEISIGMSNISNALAQGILYNPKNGVRTFRMYNIDGNWNADIRYKFFTPFGKNSQFNLSSETFAAYNRSVDFSGSLAVNIEGFPPRRIVNSFTTNENIKLNWQAGRYRVSALANIHMNRYMSSDAGFSDFTSWTCNYGASAVLNLPHNWGLSTDLTLYTRRGFADKQLNTTDFVWNARVTKSMLKGSLVFVADAYDLLHQLSNIAYTVNAQARTETVSNVIPAYVLFHVQWRFNKQPKK